MKLIDYPGLFGQWPPPAHNAASETVLLEHCLDTVIVAFRIINRQGPWLFHIDILTTFQGVRYIRRLQDVELIFARILCDFLTEQGGKTIHEIGEMDVSFLV
jgi:hypothetical protein